MEISRHLTDFQLGPVYLSLGWDINTRVVTLNSITGGKTAKTSAYTFNAPPTLSVGYAVMPGLSLGVTGKLGLFGTYGYFKDKTKTSLPWTLSSQVTYATLDSVRVFGKAAAINDDLYASGVSNGIKIMTVSAQLGVDYLMD